MKTRVKPANQAFSGLIQNPKTKYVTPEKIDMAVSILLECKKQLTPASIQRHQKNMAQINLLFDNCKSERTKLLLAIFIEEFETIHSVFSPLAHKYEQEA